MNLKGKVKTVTFMSYKTNKKTGEIYKDSLTLKSVAKFDEKGNKVEEDSYKPNDELTYQDICKYDDKNNLVEEDRTEPAFFSQDTGTKKNGLNMVKYTYTNKYDDKGHLIELHVMQGPRAWYYDKYQYDADGNRIEDKHYQPGDTLNKTENYKYDNGNMVEQNWFNGNNEQIGKYVNVYDGQSRLTETSFYGALGKLNWKETKEYDEFGNKTKSTSYGKDGQVTYVTTIKYSNFDKNNNWQQCVYFNNQNESESGVIRTIEYYQ